MGTVSLKVERSVIVEVLPTVQGLGIAVIRLRVNYLKMLLAHLVNVVRIVNLKLEAHYVVTR